MSNPIYYLLDVKPQTVYIELFDMRHITNRLKLKIIAACLSDEKSIQLNGIDPKARNNKIHEAALSLDKVIAKKEKIQTEP